MPLPAPPTLKPVPAEPEALPADTYAVRHRAWYEGADIIRSSNDHALRIWQTQCSGLINEASTKAQADRAMAEEHVATAGLAAAASQQAAASALLAPATPLTDAERLSRYFDIHLNGGLTAQVSADFAKRDLTAYKRLVTPLPGAPQ